MGLPSQILMGSGVQVCMWIRSRSVQVCPSSDLVVKLALARKGCSMAEKRQSTQKTFQLSIEGGHRADHALLMYGTKRSLAAALKMSSTTITNFFARRDVEQAKFKKICRELKLKWEEVIEAAIQEDKGIDALVQKIRAAILPLIQGKCGTMIVLDMDQAIEDTLPLP